MNEKHRAAGVLMHITSLPSVFGIGDMGPEARSFAQMLHRCRQTYWQLLPLGPTEQGQGHSPYSSISSLAGNTLLISPEQLAIDGLLNHDELYSYHLHRDNKANYSGAEQVKQTLFNKAWNNFSADKHHPLKNDFAKFCKREAEWLDDFALFMLLKQVHGHQPWFHWPTEYKLRDKKSLHQLAAANTETIEMVKWLQFIFAIQWQSLRHHCHNLGIQLFGDLPFYISYDLVDVWANREIFSLNDEGNMTGVAGVPPDAFSSDGQLWGMPVFLWDKLKKLKYKWWVDRLRKNVELFDLLRLDHFRAFADYWEVPAGDSTAKNGQWKKGPGDDLFHTLKKELGELPFIAEDLGEIDQPVYDLRDQFKFPGMKILQFAFGDNMPQSPHIPHNYAQNFVAYTGTHDNNTIVGWYRQDGYRHQQQVAAYVGKTLSQHDVHIELARLVFASVTAIAILPMQDILGLDEEARMNIPASENDNWSWRMLPGQMTQQDEDFLCHITRLYNRDKR